MGVIQEFTGGILEHSLVNGRTLPFSASNSKKDFRKWKDKNGPITLG